MIEKTGFQKVVSILVAMSLLGCTTLKPIEAQPNVLQDRIRHEHIVEVGDRVRLYTEEGKEHQFKVMSIDTDHISGEDTKVPIDDIVALETHEISIGKTTLLAGGMAGLGFLLLILIAAPVIFLAPG